MYSVVLYPAAKKNSKLLLQFFILFEKTFLANCVYRIILSTTHIHTDPKVESSHVKNQWELYQSLLKTKTKNTSFAALKYTCLGLLNIHL